MINIGDTFPKFELEAVENDTKYIIKHKNLKGKWTILFFYPEDFSFVCPTEATGYNKQLDAVIARNCQIIGVSTDSTATHIEWIKELGLNYPLISDSEGQLSKAAGVFDSSDGRANRATFILNPQLEVEFIMVTTRNVGRSPRETVRVLEAILTGNQCPADYVVK